MGDAFQLAIAAGTATWVVGVATTGGAASGGAVPGGTMLGWWKSGAVTLYVTRRRLMAMSSGLHLGRSSSPTGSGLEMKTLRGAACCEAPSYVRRGRAEAAVILLRGLQARA